MLPVCSAAPCCSSFPRDQVSGKILTKGPKISSHVGSRMFNPRKGSEDRYFTDERPPFYARGVNHAQDMSLKAQATKFKHSLAVETPDISASQDSSTFSSCPNSFDDIVGGFSIETLDEEHENWSCLANEINSSCPLAKDLKYVENSDIPGPFVLNHELSYESSYDINHGASLEAMTSQNIYPSTVADSKVHMVANILDSLDQSLNRISNLIPSETLPASDAMESALPGSQVVIPHTIEVVSLESSDLKENVVASFLSGIEESVDKLQGRAEDSMTTAFNAWKLSLLDLVKSVTDTYDSAVSSLFSSIDSSKGEASNELTGLSIKLEQNISHAGAVVIDILRWIIITLEDSLSNGATFVFYSYLSAKSFLPTDVRNVLNMFEDEVRQSLSPIGATLQEVYEAIEDLERKLGLDPSDPLVPFLLLLGSSGAIGISYWLFFRNGGYHLSPEQTSELLKNDENAVLVDVRPEVIRERDGIPDLRRGARSRYASINLPEIDNSIRKQLKGGKEVDNALIAVLIRNLKNIREGSKIIVMDADTGRSKAITRLLKKLGVKKPYLVEGGFQAWTRKGLRTKEPKLETALTVLNEEMEAILEDIKPTPVLLIGYGLGTFVAIYALLEWEKTLQIIGIVGLGQTLYRRIASYESSEDLNRDVRLLLLAPVSIGAQAISWVTGKLEPKMIGLPTSPSSTTIQDRVLQAAAKHESQPANAEDIQSQARESSGEANEKLDLSEA